MVRVPVPAATLLSIRELCCNLCHKVIHVNRLPVMIARPEGDPRVKGSAIRGAGISPYTATGRRRVSIDTKNLSIPGIT